MPVYEYIEDGKKVLRVLPVSQRDSFPGRITVPSRIAVCPKGQASAEADGMRGLYQIEQQLGTGVFGRGFPFTVEQTRKAWGKNRSTDN